MLAVLLMLAVLDARGVISRYCPPVLERRPSIVRKHHFPPAESKERYLRAWEAELPFEKPLALEESGFYCTRCDVRGVHVRVHLSVNIL